MRIDEITQPAIEQAIELMTQRCGPYLQEIGGLKNALVNYPLYRGTEFVAKFQVVAVRQDRKPLATPRAIHDQIDDWFEANSKTGIRYRSQSLFCSGNVRMASGYADYTGGAVIVLPIGRYHYLWSQNRGDLFNTIMHHARQEGSPPDIPTFLQDSYYIEDRHLLEAIDSRNEIMLHCQEAVLVNRRWAEKLAENL